MAKYIVPPKEIIIKCYRCKTLYVPEFSEKHGTCFEECPVCGFLLNDKDNVIPLWRYNLIKLFRGGFRKGKE